MREDKSFSRTVRVQAMRVLLATGCMQFLDNSTAGSADIENGGDILFSIGATASSANILNFSLGETEFSDSSTAGNATINGYDTSFIEFFDISTAGSATIQ